MVLTRLLAFHPHIIPPETLLIDILNIINESRSSCLLPKLHVSIEASSPLGESCFIVGETTKPLGILTEADIMRAIAQSSHLNEIKAADIMAQNDTRSAFQFLELLQAQRAREIMTDKFVCVSLDTSVMDVITQMVENQSNHAVIASSIQHLGMLTASEVMQLQSLQVDLLTLPVSSVMLIPTTFVHADDSLWHVYQQMQRLGGTRDLIVVDGLDHPVGIITFSHLLNAIEPVQTHYTITALQQQIGKLQQENLELLHILKSSPDTQVQSRISRLQNLPEVESILALLFLRLRQCLEVEEILETVAQEVRLLLQTDQVLIYQFKPGWIDVIQIESIAPDYPSLLGSPIPSIYYELGWLECYHRGNAKVISDTHTSGLDPSLFNMFEQLQVRASLAIAIPYGKGLWGLLIVHHHAPRQWQTWETELMEQLVTHLAITIHQISLLEQSQVALAERKQIEERLFYNALYDTLTGLPNRVLFLERLRSTFDRSQESTSHTFAVLFLDVDRFKVINDSLGHAIGDQLLIQVADRLKPCLRSSDTVARFGGDEFVILLEEIESIDSAAQVASRIVQEFKRAFNLSGHEVLISISIGVAISNTSYASPEEILQDADIAMYRAKNRGKAQYIVFDLSMRDRAIERLQLENDLRQAIAREEFEVYYQPIVSPVTNRIAGFEALLRWSHPVRGFITPQEFIPLAEETGLVIPIGEWVLFKACHQLRLWQEQFFTNPPLTVSVNISSIQIVQSKLLEKIESILQETNLDPKCLKLEITETVMMENLETCRDRLEALRKIGVQVYMDDFGTGYSSFSYLQNLPIDVLKIDRSFVNKITTDENTKKIVQAILRLAHGMSMSVIAEGVETLEQMDCFGEMGNGLVQGYYISKPLDISTATAWIMTNLELNRL